MHWGTYINSEEPFDEPPKLVKIELKEKGLKENEVDNWN